MGFSWRSGLALIMLIVVLTGCWDRTEIEDQSYIIALGLDRGEARRLMVTAQVAIVQSLTTGTLGATRPTAPQLAVQLLTAEADTMTQAIHILNGGMTRRLDLRHLRAVLVGEPLARVGLEPVFTSLRPVGELNPARAMEGYILQAKSLHLGPPVRMHHFLNRLSAAGGEPFLPVMAVNPGITAGPDEPRGVAGDSALPGELPRGAVIRWSMSERPPSGGSA